MTLAEGRRNRNSYLPSGRGHPGALGDSATVPTHAPETAGLAPRVPDPVLSARDRAPAGKWKEWKLCARGSRGCFAKLSLRTSPQAPGPSEPAST